MHSFPSADILGPRVIRRPRFSMFAAAALLSIGLTVGADARPRARDLGVPLEGHPGPLNAITDVAGVEVGQATLIRGDGPLHRGAGPVRTGVTVIFPQGKAGRHGVAAGRAVINGTGEFTGMALVDEVGQLFGPIALTGTGNISVVRDAIIDWTARSGYIPEDELVIHSLPAVGETLDMPLSDVFGHPMKPQDVWKALDSASRGPVAEGNVGGGTGMIAYRFKGGIGTSSRVVTVRQASYTVGVLVQANHGNRGELRIAGVPVGREIADLLPYPDTAVLGQGATPPQKSVPTSPKNSLLIILATDAPLQSHQLQRLARRAAMGLGRTGSFADNYSGEFALAFSTTNSFPWDGSPVPGVAVNDNDQDLMNALFEAATQATEEAIVNQLVASETMTGADGATVYGLPHARLVALLKKYGRYVSPGK